MVLLVSFQQVVGLDEVVKNFKQLINMWCQQQSKLRKKPEHLMCQIAVDEFGHIFSKDHIRKSIDPKFKIHWRVKNGQRSWTKKTAEKASLINSNFSSGLLQGTINARG